MRSEERRPFFMSLLSLALASAGLLFVLFVYSRERWPEPAPLPETRERLGRILVRGDSGVSSPGDVQGRVVLVLLDRSEASEKIDRSRLPEGTLWIRSEEDPGTAGALAHEDWARLRGDAGEGPVVLIVENGMIDARFSGADAVAKAEERLR